LTWKGEIGISAEASKVSNFGVRRLCFMMFSVKYTYYSLGQLREE
jgi:ABC-type glucose/galactose transport system permease subunit